MCSSRALIGMCACRFFSFRTITRGRVRTRCIQAESICGNGGFDAIWPSRFVSCRALKWSMTVISLANEKCLCKAVPQLLPGWVSLQMHTRGIEPGSRAWETCIIPLHYVCLRIWPKIDFLNPTIGLPCFRPFVCAGTLQSLESHSRRREVRIDVSSSLSLEPLPLPPHSYRQVPGLSGTNSNTPTNQDTNRPTHQHQHTNT